MAPRASSESSETKTGEPPIRCARAAAEVSTARTTAETKRGRHDVDDSQSASPSSALQVRMGKELLALHGLVQRAKLILPRSGSASPPRRRSEAPPPPPVVAPPSAAKRRASPSSKAAPAMEKTEVPKKRRRQEEEEELARAAAREEFRRMLLEMEKTALPDETIYPEDLKELGIAFEHVVTRTKKEAWQEDRRMPAARLHGIGMTVLAV